MTIQEIQALENMLNDPGTAISETMKTTILANITYEESKQHAFNDSFHWFYSDIIEKTLQFNFKGALGEALYIDACADADACLHMSLEVRTIPPALINNWLNAALKTVDNIVIHYIQDYLKVPFISYPSLGEESSRYRQLAYEVNPLGQAGTRLENLYSLYRNAYEHRTKRDTASGRLVINRGDLVRRRREIINLLKPALVGLLETYKEKYAHCVIPIAP